LKSWEFAWLQNVHRQTLDERLILAVFPICTECDTKILEGDPMRRTVRKTFPLRVLFVLTVSTLGQGLTAATLDQQLRPVIDNHQGDVSVAIRHLSTGASFQHRANVPMPTASLIKFPVMIEAFRQIESGELRLDQPIVLRDDDKVPGSGILTPHFSAGTTLSLQDAMHLMIVFSDNTATNLVLDKIGLDNVGSTMESLGAANTKIFAKVYRRDTTIAAAKSQQFGLGSTTAAEMIHLFAELDAGRLVSQDACRQMRDHLNQCDDRSKLGRDLPSGTKLAHKSGAVARARCDAGLLKTASGIVAICVLTANNEDRRFEDDNQANLLIGKIAHITYQHFSTNSKPISSTRKTLKNGDHGRLVEFLQKTLNARLRPSPRLSVDGDFGPMTQQAVRRFQELAMMEGTGIVDVATWKALGPLVTTDATIPPPETINQEKLPTAKAERLDGPPFVTCRAWYAVDGATGHMLDGEHADRVLDIASTTKVMTAYIVLNAAKTDPAILDEMVTFSDRADRTIGSTAGVIAGERVSVGELLYGLLLPSGNDASVALAEHFGPRLAKSFATDSDGGDPLDQFVAAMNRTAKALGMANSHFENPHGLTARGHKSTARDMAKLAWTAYQSPGFQGYVRTRQRGCTLVGPGEYRRNVLWKNTNQLLGTQGYLGIKTGTTTAAGACLISMSERDGRTILLVTLGSATSATRYTDARNLFRWLWLNHLQPE
jgi:D-alanyl-D-alanine carboxypeptidase (penicillin-binding protein 5/6)